VNHFNNNKEVLIKDYHKYNKINKEDKFFLQMQEELFRNIQSIPMNRLRVILLGKGKNLKKIKKKDK